MASTSAPRSRELVATTTLIAVTAIWGSTFIVVKDAVQQMPALDFLFWRFLIATLVVGPLRPRACKNLGARGLRRGAAIGLVLGAGYVLQTVGLEHTPATVSGFITGLFVVFTPLCAGVLLRRRVPNLAWLGVGLATIGLALIALRGWQIGAGEWLTLGCAFMFALQIIGLGEWAPHHDPAALAIVQLGVTTLICLVGAAPASLAPPPTAKVWAAVGLTSIAATALAFVVQTWAQSILNPTRAAIVLTSEPVFAAIFGVAVGGEPFGFRTAIGALCVLGAMLLVELPPGDSDRRGPAAAETEPTNRALH